MDPNSLVSCGHWRFAPYFIVCSVCEVRSPIHLVFSPRAINHCRRFYCRTVYAKQLGLDDYFIAIALIVVIALGISNGFQISWGAGFARLQMYKGTLTF